LVWLTFCCAAAQICRSCLMSSSSLRERWVSEGGRAHKKGKRSSMRAKRA
jgi:hypothetical protein